MADTSRGGATKTYKAAIKSRDGDGIVGPKLSQTINQIPVSVRFQWLAGLAGAVLAVGVQAAEPPPARALSLAELTSLALRNHPDTRVAWAAVEQSQGAERIARAGWWPTITASYTAQRSRSITNAGEDQPAQTRYGPSVSLSWLLLDFGNRSGTIDRAAASTVAAQYGLNQTLQDRVLAVESAYYTVLGVRALASAEQLAVDAARANLDAARTRHKAGLATIADVYQVEAALAAAELSQLQAQGQQRIAEGTLAAASGYAPDTPLSLAEEALVAESVAMPELSLTDFLGAARRARPELLAAVANEQAAAAAARAARGSALPALRVNASAGQTHVVDRGSSEQYSGSVTLSVPLFAGGALQGAIQQARAAQRGASASTEATRLAVEQQVWIAYRNLETAHGSLRAAAAQLTAAQRSTDAIRARYRNGLSSVLELLTAESTLSRARVDSAQASLDWSLALATLAHDAGTLETGADGASP